MNGFVVRANVPEDIGFGWDGRMPDFINAPAEVGLAAASGDYEDQRSIWRLIHAGEQ